MSRPLLTRFAVLTAAAGCLAAAVGPASAATTPYPFPVTVTTTGGARQFAVTQTDGTTPVQGFAFGTSLRELPFQVKVSDQGVPLLGNNYAVSATMSNMYYKPTPTTTDYSTMIPSNQVGLAYSPSSLRATGLQLPVVPQVSLTGALSCSTLGPLENLTGALLDACTLLLDPITNGGAVDTVATGATQVLTEAELAVNGVLDVAKLPLSLTGAQEGGRFVTPAKLDANDPVSGAGATAKRIMTGTNLLTGSTLADAAARVDAALDAALVGAPILPKDGAGSLVTQNELLTALSQQASLASVVEKLRLVTDQSQVAAVVAGVNGVVNDVTVNQLSVMSGNYSSLPILTVAPVTIRAGAYEGQLTVDFFQE